MKNVNVRVLAEISICAAIGFVLDFVQGLYSDFLPAFFNGGSVGIAMVAVFIVAYRRGFIPSLICGLIIGLLDMIGAGTAGTTVLDAILGFCLDYVFAYGVCSIAAVFFKQIRGESLPWLYVILGCLVGGLAKLTCHTLSGCIIWDVPLWGSITYNAAFIIPSAILCSIVMVLVFIKNKKLFLVDSE